MQKKKRTYKLFRKIVVIIICIFYPTISFGDLFGIICLNLVMTRLGDNLNPLARWVKVPIFLDYWFVVVVWPYHVGLNSVYNLIK